MYLLLPLLVVCFALLIQAMPAERFPRQYTSSNTDYLKNTFLGIYWDDAAVSCSGDQFNILAEATRMLGPFSNINPFHWDDNPAFNRFFVSPRKAKYGSSWHVSKVSWPAAYAHIIDTGLIHKPGCILEHQEYVRYTQLCSSDPST